MSYQQTSRPYRALPGSDTARALPGLRLHPAAHIRVAQNRRSARPEHLKLREAIVLLVLRSSGLPRLASASGGHSAAVDPELGCIVFLHVPNRSGPRIDGPGPSAYKMNLE